MPLVSFQFSAEALKPPDEQRGAELPTESLLFQDQLGGRVEYLTNARQRGIKWLPELNHSVVNVFADTWACVCCRFPALGCSRGYNYCGLQLYSISFTRAQWLWICNLVCFVVHQTMAYLCFTACNGSRIGMGSVNPDCTPEAMSVPLYRLTATCKFYQPRTRYPGPAYALCYCRW